MDSRFRLIGAHQSIAGGVYKALERAFGYGSKTLQIFTKNSNRWIGKKIPPNDIEKFIDLKVKYNIKSVIAHAAYLINLASDNKETVSKSLISLKDEIENCKLLGIKYLVLHPGSHKGAGEKAGIKQIAGNLNKLFDELGNSGIKILLETTAGQGNSVGHKLEHLREIYNRVDFKDNVGFCLDTCHLFAAGYDFRKKESYLNLREQFETILGLENIHVIHLNDSKKSLNSKVDRHEHIGKGKIGLKPFAFFLNDEYFREIPFIIETPKENNMDEVNINLLTGLIT